MENFALHLAILIVFLSLGMSLLYPIKEISKPFKIVIFIIFLNLLLTIYLPNFSLLNILTLEKNLDFEKSATDFWAIRGQIGDLIAGHFTALAFIGILINISQMRKSLDKQDEAIKIQQKEMQNQQKEMQATTKSLELQSKLIEKQNFDNTYFKMLESFINIKKTINYKNYETKNFKIGEEALLQYFMDWIGSDDSLMTLEKFYETNIEFSNKNHLFLSHYFRTLYRIFKYVDEYNDIYNQIDRNHYIKLVRAQLSSSELFLIMCNSLDPTQYKSKIYLEKYSILEHLTGMKFFKKWYISILDQFEVKAFGDGILSDIDNRKEFFYSENNADR